MEFKCYTCDRIFDAEGSKVEYMDPMYGLCAKTVAGCPDCGGECTEYRKPKPQKSSTSGPQDSCPAYHSGSCSCCH